MQRLSSRFFPQQKNTRWLRNGLGLFLFFIVLYIIGSFIPEGFDWKILKVSVPYFWTPWSKYVLKAIVPFGHGLVFALSLIGFCVRAYRYNRSPLPLVLGLISLPTIWVLFDGTLDGLVLFGMLVMPPGILLLLMKPQIASFAVLAKRSWLISAVVLVLVSFVIWGFWPLNFLVVTTPEWKVEWQQDISLFPWGLLAAVPLLWFSRGDEDLLMAAGSLATPHLFPYHFILLMPALARMRWYWMLPTWIVTWTPLLSNWLGPWAWHFGNLVSVFFWLGITFSRDRTQIRSVDDPITTAVRLVQRIWKRKDKN